LTSVNVVPVPGPPVNPFTKLILIRNYSGSMRSMVV
jgi:hypothetical protein